MSVRQRGKKWYYEFMINNNRYNGACKGATSQKNAITYENVVKSDVMRGNLSLVKKKSTIKLSTMIQQYLDYSKINKSSYTHDKTYSKYWLAYFGDKFIADIKPIDIEGYKTYRHDKGIKPSTINRELNSLSKMFSIAVQNGYILINPKSHVKKLQIENKKPRVLSKAEEKRLFEATGEHWIKPILITALQTGMRKSEILGLRHDCVDFKKKYADILKTKSGKARQIPMSEKLYEALKSQPKINEYMFVNPITKNKHGNVHDVFSGFITKAKIKNFRFHDLRHTAATRMVEHGIDLVVVKEILGHSNINTTMIYAHPVKEIMLKAVKVLNDY